MPNFSFEAFTPEQLSSLVSVRENETKIGQVCLTGLANDAKYVLLGINEDIGPQTNLGRPGAKNGFNAFLSRFLNMQSTSFLSGDSVSFLGQINQTTSFSSVSEGMKQIIELDQLVQSKVAEIFQAGKIPIIIGGGHNNALPIIKAYNAAYNTNLDVVNLDPHADTRALEGRHSGNSFSYGLTQNWINKYTVLGLHKPYNSTFILNFLDQYQCDFTFFDDYLLGRSSFEKDIEKLHASTVSLGVELDMDSIAFMPSSAQSPTGWRMEEARKFILLLKQSKRKIVYLHLPEAAPTTTEEQLLTGKALAYLVYDFML